MDVSEADVYDVILTRAEIQEALDMINAMVKKEIAAAKRECFIISNCLMFCWLIVDTDQAAIGEVNSAIQSGDLQQLLNALIDGDARLSGIKEENIRLKGAAI